MLNRKYFKTHFTNHILLELNNQEFVRFNLFDILAVTL